MQILLSQLFRLFSVPRLVRTSVGRTVGRLVDRLLRRRVDTIVGKDESCSLVSPNAPFSISVHFAEFTFAATI